MKVVESMELPKEQGIAFEVRRGHLVRVIEVEGPQVVDFIAFALDNHSERLCAGRTRAQVGVHPKKGDSLWSLSPYERAMFTLVDDTVAHQPSPTGAIGHDLLYACCARSVYVALGVPDHPNCHQNLAQAIQPWGLAPKDVHTPFNLFMKTGLKEDGTMFFEAPDSVQGDYVDLRAEMDCLVGLSACPSGDLQVTNGGSNKPIRVEILMPDGG